MIPREDASITRMCVFATLPVSCTVYASPLSFLKFINAIIGKYYLAQYLPVQSPHTTAAILFLTS